MYIYIHTLYCIFREEPMSLCAFPQIFSPQHGFGVQRCYGFRISLPTVKQATFERPPCALGEWSNQNQGANGEATPFRNSWDNPSWKLGLPSANNVAWMMDLLQFFSTTLLQSKQWCFDNKGNKWKHVSSMTSMYCFITDWYCSFVSFKLVKLRYFSGI